MKRIGTLLALALLLGTISPAGAETVDSYRWKNRVLILFAAEATPEVNVQRDSLLPYEHELSDRDMVIFAVLGSDRVEPIYGKAPSDQEAPKLRSKFGITDDAPFTALLVGMDGGVKWRANRPAEREELFGLIDSMPMRRNRT